MGSFWRLMKLSYSSVKVQKEIEQVLQNKDGEAAKRIIGNYIGRVLEEGLSRRNLNLFLEVWNADQTKVKERLVEAFRRGWDESESAKGTNFSTALRITLLEAEQIIKEHKRKQSG